MIIKQVKNIFRQVIPIYSSDCEVFMWEETQQWTTSVLPLWWTAF